MARDTSLTDFGSDDDPESAASDGSASDRPSETESTSEPREGSTSEPAESTPGGADGDATRRSGDAGGDATAGSEIVDDGIARPLTTTYAVTGDDRPCDRCGAVAARRWRDGGALVCGDCKDW